LYVNTVGEKYPPIGCVGDVDPMFVIPVALAVVQIDVAFSPTTYWVEFVA
jgi:hypothetical protein